MAPRLQLEKAAWRWVETVKPEDISPEHIDLAYRVNLPACKRGTCRYDVNVSQQHTAVVCQGKLPRASVTFDFKAEDLMVSSAEGCASKV